MSVSKTKTINTLPPGSLVITNVNKGNVICGQGILANTFRTRLFGLLGCDSLLPDTGLLIQPSSGVHTFGMSFPIDIVALDKNSKVVALSHNTIAWKVRGLSRKTRSVLELPAGRIRECGLESGDEVNVQIA
jgi:uncharacterized membrane protein (UPF0127 family)